MKQKLQAAFPGVGFRFYRRGEKRYLRLTGVTYHLGGTIVCYLRAGWYPDCYTTSAGGSSRTIRLDKRG